MIRFYLYCECVVNCTKKYRFVQPLMELCERQKSAKVILVSDIIFTSGGTEANNMVLNTAVEHFIMRWIADSVAEPSLPHIISSSLEHDSIKLVLERYQNIGRAGYL